VDTREDRRHDSDPALAAFVHESMTSKLAFHSMPGRLQSFAMTDGRLWVTTFLTSVVGSGTIAWGVVRGLGRHLADRWLANHKADLDRELEAYKDVLEQKRQRVEAELGHSVYVTQTQFDTEFSALKNIFAALAKTRLTFNSIAPDVGIYIEDEHERLENLSGRLTQFIHNTNALTDTAESLYPFVPEEIYEHIHECIKRAQIEILHIRTSGPKTFSMEWNEDRAKQRDKFNEHYYQAVKLSREHFKRMTIVPTR
jgi:hypothetical protein